jgi:hypothetical protein
MLSCCGPIGSVICFLSQKNEDLQMDPRAPTLIMHAHGMFQPDVLFVNLNLLNCISYLTQVCLPISLGMIGSPLGYSCVNFTMSQKWCFTNYESEELKNVNSRGSWFDPLPLCRIGNQNWLQQLIPLSDLLIATNVLILPQPIYFSIGPTTSKSKEQTSEGQYCQVCPPLEC